MSHTGGPAIPIELIDDDDEDDPGADPPDVQQRKDMFVNNLKLVTYMGSQSKGGREQTLMEIISNSPEGLMGF